MTISPVLSRVLNAAAVASRRSPAAASSAARAALAATIRSSVHLAVHLAPRCMCGRDAAMPTRGGLGGRLAREGHKGTAGPAAAADAATQCRCEKPAQRVIRSRWRLRPSPLDQESDQSFVLCRGSVQKAVYRAVACDSVGRPHFRADRNKKHGVCGIAMYVRRVVC